MNYARDVVDAADLERIALIELARDGSRRTMTFEQVATRSAAPPRARA